VLNAQLELEPHTAALNALQPRDVIGTSGTARAINNVLRENNWSETGITRDGLERLVQTLLETRKINKFKLAGLSEERRPVFAGGVAVMKALFNSLDLEFMRVSEGSLREGVLHELIGRERFEDRRAVTVLELMKRHHIDTAQGQRVSETTLVLFNQVRQQDLLKRERRLLGWAALLHEIGLMIAHSQHHVHGAYVLENMDLPGFSRQEQGALSIMVRLHRRKYLPDLIEGSSYVRSAALGIMTRLLRLGVLFNRGRQPIDLPSLELEIESERCMVLRIDEKWLDDHPLTAADLRQEVELLRAVDHELRLVTR
jgi:exopolyphosphatase/guanosine-5'-triphosphate,3'-diphosphate pyrophosphatase